MIYNTGSEDYETAELHMENGRFVRGPVIRAYCSFDGNTVRGSATQTDILGTKFGGVSTSNSSRGTCPETL